MQPFSNGTQYGDWTASNCDRCKKSETNGGECDIEIALMDACFTDGEITDEIAMRLAYEPKAYVWMCGEVAWCEWWMKEVMLRQIGG